MEDVVKQLLLCKICKTDLLGISTGFCGCGAVMCQNCFQQHKCNSGERKVCYSNGLKYHSSEFLQEFQIKINDNQNLLVSSNDKNALFFGTPMTMTTDQLNSTYNLDMMNFTVQEEQSELKVDEKKNIEASFSQLFDTFRAVHQTKAKRTYSRSSRDPMTPIVKMSRRETQFLSESSDEEKDMGFSSSSSFTSPTLKSMISPCLTPDVVASSVKPNAENGETSSKSQTSKDVCINNTFNDDSLIADSSTNCINTSPDQKLVVSRRKRSSSCHIPKELNNLSSPYDFWFSSHSRVTRRTFAKCKDADSKTETPVTTRKRRQSQKTVKDIKPKNKKCRSERNKSFSSLGTEGNAIKSESIQSLENNHFPPQHIEEEMCISDSNFNSILSNNEICLESNIEEKLGRASSSFYIMKDCTNMVDYKYTSEDCSEPRVIVITETFDENHVLRAIETRDGCPDKENVFETHVEANVLNPDQDSHESIQIEADGDFLIETCNEVSNNENVVNSNLQSEVLNSSSTKIIKCEHEKEVNISCEIVTYDISSDEDSKDVETEYINVENVTPTKCVINSCGDLDINYYISAYKKQNVHEIRNSQGNDSQIPEESLVRQMKTEPAEEVPLTNGRNLSTPEQFEENYSTDITTGLERQISQAADCSQNSSDRLNASVIFIDQTEHIIKSECKDPLDYNSEGPTSVQEEESIEIFEDSSDNFSNISSPSTRLFKGFTESQVYISFMKYYLCEAAKGKDSNTQMINYRGDKYLFKMSFRKLPDEEDNTSLVEEPCVSNDAPSSPPRNTENCISLYPNIPSLYLIEDSSVSTGGTVPEKASTESTDVIEISSDQHNAENIALTQQNVPGMSTFDGTPSSLARNFSDDVAYVQTESRDIFSIGCSSSSRARTEADPLFIDPSSLSQDVPPNDFWNSYALSSPPSPSIVTRTEPTSEDETSEEDIIEGTPQKANLTFCSLNASHRSSINSPATVNETVEFINALCEEVLAPPVNSAYSYNNRMATENSRKKPSLICDINELKVVIAVTGLPISERETVQMFADTFGYEFTNSLHRKYTILVMSPRKQEAQTFKYLLAIASRAKIVSMSWINESLRAKRPLPPEEFILIKEGGPLRCLHDIPPPLTGTTICIELLQDGYPGGLAIQVLCQLAGAKVIMNVDQIDSPSRNVVNPFPRLFLFREESQLTSQILNKCSNHLAVAVSFQWLYECLYAYRRLPIVGYLSSTFVFTPDLLTDTYQIPVELVPYDD